MPIKKKNKFNNTICENDMTFEECELSILRQAIDDGEEAQKQLKIDKRVNGEEMEEMFAILETFIIKKKLVLYGGFAINTLLPTYAQFYDKQTDIPDYDCYSSQPMEDAIELADIFFKKGYTEVEARAGVHFGTYKVFVNFIGIADITLLEKSIFKNIQKEAVIINKIKYCPVNFLRRNMFKELSQPLGDITRWEKVFKRLNILNHFYPLSNDFSKSLDNCENVDFQRKMETNVENSEKIYNVIRDAFIFMGAIFFGGYACSLYSQFMSEKSKNIVAKIPDFDVLYDDIEKGALIVKEKLKFEGFSNVILIKHEEIYEIIPAHYEIKIGGESLAFIYAPNACYSYNTITVNTKQINVASIDTILFFHLSFYYSNQPYYYRDRILCIVKILFDIQQEHKLDQTGILKRFNPQCIGTQQTIDEIRKTKTMKFKELYKRSGSLEYQKWFLKYNPANAKPRRHRGRWTKRWHRPRHAMTNSTRNVFKW
jgi:hypothetical protein